MEALVAVGLAANIVQFVQVAGALISEANSISSSGSPSSIPQLRDLSNLTKQTALIKANLQVNPNLSREDEFLLDIASKCHSAGTELITYLDTFSVKPGSSNPLRAARASIKFKWEHHKLQDFVSQLDKLRETFTLSTILALRTSAKDSNEKMVGQLEALEAGSRTRGVENTATRDAIQHLVEIVQRQAGQKLDRIQTHIQDCITQIQELSKQLPQDRERGILKWLNFRQMYWRYEQIPSSYQQTCQWIFREPRDEDGWGDFRAHLTATDVVLPYFICGKSGSGKSTLMKFIADNPQTEKLLHRWADGEEILVINFFFWNLGTTLQKSVTGMLRSFIHSVLQRYPD
ncbi:hypothetical protein AJ80_01550 [Polytolypa hystricis UAMH7299]|uniref:Nephrocystin 3-like N-terminal domain-containing protein n=1 Tax=Polytolypa hystricis (strain UAMH7299) TaxID=1447883 RepID=A0A2B7YZM0_POLH7|nr:hypothetical protein AJ80_01550 [Polytolypa hystricis UAMH7299]